MLGDYDEALNDLQEAVRMDPSDPNDIQQEIIQMRAKANKKNKEAE